MFIYDGFVCSPLHWDGCGDKKTPSLSRRQCGREGGLHYTSGVYAPLRLCRVAYLFKIHIVFLLEEGG